MEHNKFRVILTGKYKKKFDLAVLAERIAEHSEITPIQAQKLISLRKPHVLNESLQHAKAYQTKRFLQESGAEIRLEPAFTYYSKDQEEEKTSTKKKWFSFKSLNPFRKKNKKEQRVDIDWEEKPRFNRSTIIYSNKTKLPIGLMIKGSLVLVGIWYFWLKAITTDISGDGFDEYGEPIVMVFTSKECLADCSKVLGDIRVRKVPIEHYIINMRLKDDEKYKLWKKYSQGKFPLVMAGKNTLTNASKTGMATVLGLTFGDKYLSQTEKALYKKHFHEDGSPKIAIYCKSNDRVCQQLNKKLNIVSLKFSYIEVDKLDNEKAVIEAMELDKFPTMWKGYKKMEGTDVSGISLMFN